MPHLDVVVDEDLPEIEDLEDGLGRVVGDGVSLEDVLDGGHLPGEPPLAEGGVDAEHARRVAGLAAAAPAVLLHALRDRLHLALLAVRAAELQPANLKRVEF